MKTNEIIEEGHSEYLKQKAIQAIAEWFACGNMEHLEYEKVHDPAAFAEEIEDLKENDMEIWEYDTDLDRIEESVNFNEYAEAIAEEMKRIQKARMKKLGWLKE